MLSKVNAESVFQKMIELARGMNLVNDINIGFMRLQTNNIVLEAVEDGLVVAELAEDLVTLWFPFMLSLRNSPNYAQWIEINTKVSGIIFESGYYDDDIWSRSDDEDS